MSNARADVHHHLVAASSYDVGRHELRDGSGTRMFPERIIGANAATVAAEVNKALARRSLRNGRPSNKTKKELAH